MFPILRSVVNIIRRCPLAPITSHYHVMSQPILAQTRLLAPIVSNIVPSCGFKVKGNLKRRCKDCYFVKRENRLFVICKTHPRHKQMAMVKDPKTTWTLTYACQSKVRPW